MRARKFAWDDMPAEQVNEHFSRKMIVGENEMMCLLELRPGCKVPMHSHENEQISHCIRGRIRFEVDGEIVEIGAGETLLIPPHVPHSAEVVGDETVLDYDIFSPIRRDWVEGTDEYLRK